MRRLGLVPLFVGLGSCAGGPPLSERAQLVALTDCNAVLDYVRQVALDEMNRQIDDNYERYAAGNGCYYGGGEDDASGQPSPPSSNPSPGGPTQGTGTNNQVQGVDEADFVKNDGNHIYIAQNGVLRIIDSWPADQTHQVSMTTLPGTPRKLLVNGDALLVYTAIGDGNGQEECTYGYSCQFSGDGTATQLLAYDISNRAAPRLVRTIDLSGSLIAGRMIGSAIHTVVSQPSALMPAVETFPYEVCNEQLSPLQAASKFEALRETNRIAIMAATLDPTKLPAITDSNNPVPPAQACGAFYASPVADGTSFTSVVSFDLAELGQISSATIVSQPGAVYASQDALYLAVSHTNPYGGDPTVERSAIHKFGISDRARDTHYQASGYVRGHALSQFAMDEKDGNLRMATTSGYAPSDDAESQITILHRVGDRLNTIGSILHIAPTEDIRAVRFDGDMGFVVTFKKTDPLFVFDLSNPTNPRTLGELKIPGFSTYMHMLDATHLLTIGYDADDHGDFAYFDGVMLQIFDVSDPSNPRKVHDHIIGSRGSSSEALTNHLAFTWYPEENLLAVPMTVCEGGDDGTYGTNLTFSGLMVFDATVLGGFSEHGRVAATLDPDVSCGNWWTEASSVVKRSLFLEDYVYAISGTQLIVRHTSALSAPLVDLPL